MRKTIVIVTTIIILSPFILTGCNDQKDQELGKIKEQVNVLRLENSKLKKNLAKEKINCSGNNFTGLGFGVTVIMINNLIWWIIYRRKEDVTPA